MADSKLTRNKVRTDLRTLKLLLDSSGNLPEGYALDHYVGRILKLRDSLAESILSDNPPTFVTNEAEHLGWEDLTSAVDTLADAHAGRAGDDFRESVIARERLAAAMLASTRGGQNAERADKRADAMVKLAAEAVAKGTPAKLADIRAAATAAVGSTRPARSRGSQSAKRAPSVSK
jgi:hypothetical protein